MKTSEKFTKDTNFREIRENSFWKISGKIKKCYDKDQMALFGSSKHRSTIYYEYIPAEYMKENIPFIIGSGISFDGGKEQDKAVKEGAMCVDFYELRNIFTNNSFQ
jgi:hypothetical protein